jgi:hypothetical protein
MTTQHSPMATPREESPVTANLRMTADLRALQAELAANPLTAAFASGELEAGLADYERQLRDESTDPDCLEYELEELEHKIRAGLKAAGKSDEERCDIAAELAANWAGDCCGPFDQPRITSDLINSTLAVVLLDQPVRKQRLAEMQRLMPRMMESVKNIEADWEKDRADRALYESVRNAKAMVEIDRETLGIAPDAELTHEVIEEAKVKAEQAAGLSKRGKPFKRFANAAERLVMSIEWEIVSGGDAND